MCIVCQELERPKTKKRETPPKTPKAKGNKPTTNEKKTIAKNVGSVVDRRNDVFHAARIFWDKKNRRAN